MKIEAHSNCIVPEYFTKKFFENLLAKGLDNVAARIQKAHVSIASKSGDNYTSIVYRVEFTYSTIKSESLVEKKSFIIKCLLTNEARKFPELQVFEKEKKMYLEILPTIEELLGHVKIVPRCYLADDKLDPMLVFEDLKASGCTMADRFNGLDERHCVLALTNLAKYHAASMLLLQKDPSIRTAELLQHGIFSSIILVRDRLLKFVQQNVNTVLESMSKDLRCERLCTKISTFVNEKFRDQVIDAVHVAFDDIVVLSHGDFWINNFLFRYDNESTTPVDCIMIDFQGSAFASLGLDLNYFLATSLQIDVLKNEKDKLIEDVYYSNFKEILENANYKNIPSLDDVKKEIRKKEICGFFYGMVVLPVVSTKRDKYDSFQNFTPKADRFIETMSYLVQEYDKHGIFDNNNN